MDELWCGEGRECRERPHTSEAIGSSARLPRETACSSYNTGGGVAIRWGKRLATRLATRLPELLLLTGSHNRAIDRSKNPAGVIEKHPSCGQQGHAPWCPFE